MSKPESQTTSTGQQRAAEEIRSEIEETREELGDTVAALAQKADVKGQARKKATEVKENPASVAIAAGVVTTALVLWLIRSRRS